MADKANRDSREKLEADIATYFACWFGGGENTRKEIIGWLDRQVAITTRECREYEDELRKQHHKRVAELQSKLDAYDETHMLLPVDADGVPIHVGDKMQTNESDQEVIGIAPDYYITGRRIDGCHLERHGWNFANNAHHVKLRTLEDVLREFADRYLDYEGIPSAGRRGIGDVLMDEYVYEIREIIEKKG